MKTMRVLYPDGTESTFHTGDANVFVATVLSGEASVVEKGLKVFADEVEMVFGKAEVTPEAEVTPKLAPPVRRPKAK